MDRARVIDRIRKCLRLARSSEPHEAAAALRQAQALMRIHGIDRATLDADTVDEITRPGVRGMRPPLWHAALLDLIEMAFGVKVIYLRESRRLQVNIIGAGARAEIAAYAYDVTYRSLKDERTAFLKRQRRYKRANRSRRADLFALAWVGAVRKQVTALVPTEDEQRAVTEYLAGKALSKVAGRPPRWSARDWAAHAAGHAAGANFQLHAGIRTRTQAGALAHD